MLSDPKQTDTAINLDSTFLGGVMGGGGVRGQHGLQPQQPQSIHDENSVAANNSFINYVPEHAPNRTNCSSIHF